MTNKQINKPHFNVDQLVTASFASKHFGDLRKKAKDIPQFITDNGNVDSVLMDYDYFEKLYQRLFELEEKEELQIIQGRIERMENNPSLAVPWRKVRRSAQKED